MWGPNHVLPTDRSARFASGLSVYDFLKRTTLLACPAAASPRSGRPRRAGARRRPRGHAEAVLLRLAAAAR